ncbi:MAG TPA: hypothetical protein VFX21_12935 [Acidimicrobiia bacterium]|nr:hypothetical protein [Acidimicrobiia bacterium]
MTPSTTPGETPADALEHFWKAAHELLAAARTVLDAADGLVEAQMAKKHEPSEPRLRRIDVQDG